MSVECSELMCKILYYAKKEYFGHIVKKTEQFLKKTEDSVFKFWFCCGLALTGDENRAIRELNNMKGDKEMKIGVMGALIEIYKMSGQEDNTEVSLLADDFASAIIDAPEKCKIHLSLFYAYTGNFFEAKKLINEVEDNYKDRYVSQIDSLGWIHLLSEKDVLSFESDSIYEKERETLLYNIGKVEYFKKKEEYKECEELLSKMIVKYPNFYFSSIEKAFLYIDDNKWSDANELCEVILNKKDPLNFDAIFIHLLYLMTKENKRKIVTKKFRTLVKVVKTFENFNHKLLHKVAKNFGILAGENEIILDACVDFIKTAIKRLPMDGEYNTTLAALQMMKRQYAKAEGSYNLAIDIEESNVNANIGIVKAFVRQRKFDQAKKYLDNLNEIQETLETDSLGTAAELTFLNYLILWYYQKDRMAALEKLYETIKLFKEGVGELKFSLYYYSSFSPQFLLDVMKELILHCPKEPIAVGEIPPEEVLTLENVLKLFSSTIPGNIEGQFLYARCEFIKNNFEEALKYIQSCIKLDGSYAMAHLLASKISYLKRKFKTAHSSIELALSHNFLIRELPEYILLKAEIFLELGKKQKALNILKAGLENVSEKNYSNQEVILFLVGLAKVNAVLGRREKALDYVKLATKRVETTEDQENIIFIDSHIHLLFEEFIASINILMKIESGSLNYRRSIEKQATIYLEHLHDKKKFIELFKKLVSDNHNKQNLLGLARAYMRIHEPELAIQLYKQALELDSENYHIMSKIGEALITTHYFDDAILYYESALDQNPDQFELRFDLTNLMVMLKQYERARKLMTQTLEKIQKLKNPKPATLRRMIKIMQMLATIEEESGSVQSAVVVLKKSIQVQNSLILNLRGMEEEENEEKEVVADLNFRLAQLATTQSRKLKYYNEALSVFPNHEKTLGKLAVIYLNRSEVPLAESTAMNLLRINPKNQQGIMVMADLRFKKRRFKEAISYFQKLLEVNNKNFVVLSKLITLLRRYGKIKEAKSFLEAAKSTNPGFNYCSGLYLRGIGKIKEANSEFYKSKQSADWQENSLINMIEMYLDGQVLTKSVNKKNLQDAKKLIDQLSEASKKNGKKTLYEAYVLIGSGEKHKIENAMKLMVSELKKDKNSPTALLGFATALLKTKQETKAKNYLKMLSKADYEDEYATEFEKGWLLLSNMHISKGKYDLALTLLKKILKCNESCTQAWEIIGYVYEKEQSYVDAAECYKNAWRLSYERNPVLGFKLAFNYLKGKKFVRAIDICKKSFKRKSRLSKNQATDIK